MSSAGVAYDPSDPYQAEFLSALALGETGTSSYAATEGTGGVNLSGASTDQYGFPEWQGAGGSTAAGLFQFTQSTWDQVASQFNLNFSNPQDQEAGAWDYAQQVYAQQTQGGSLEQALQQGNYSSIQEALSEAWPSVTGNQAAPQGLAADLAEGVGSPNVSNTATAGSVGNPSVASPSAATTVSGSTPEASQGLTGWIADIEDFFVRFGLIIVGGILVVVALWVLLSEQGVVPSPGATARAAAAAL